MNDDSDESEYVDDHESGPDIRKTGGKKSNGGKTLKKQTSKKSETNREPSAIPEDIGLAPGHSRATPPKSVLRSYRDHLNSTILEITGSENGDAANHAHLEPSQMGASFWTPQEKQRLFTALQSYGPGDLLRLATAVGTKSEPEIKAYILLLQQGARELQAKSRLDLGSADLPAAAEIGLECLEAEEAAAGALEAKARAVEEGREKVKWGEEHWLIDEDVAAALDAQYEDAAEQEGDGHADSAAGEHDTVENNASSEPIDRNSDESETSPPTSLELLKASTLLQLSRTLFMNSTDPSSNWHTLAEAETNPASALALQPSIRRTALDDFHNLVVSLTRRLMQVSIFQALSRLRASSDPRVQPNVHGFDVVAARETIGLRAGGPEYWVRAVERCGVEVYADARKYRAEDGRKGTKIGYRLSEDELKGEFGIEVLETSKLARDTSDAIQDDDDDDDDDLEELDSDGYTDTGTSNRSLDNSDDENNNSTDDLSDQEEKEEAEPKNNTKPHPHTDSKSSRKKPLSPTSFARAETRHLELLDRTKSTASENDLRSALELDLLPEEKNSPRPAFPFKQAQAGVEMECLDDDWRDGVAFEALWERGGGMLPRKRDFEAMGAVGEGRRGRRKRRRVLVGMGGRVAGEVEGNADVLGGEEEEEEVEEEEEEDNESDATSDGDRSAVSSGEEEGQ